MDFQNQTPFPALAYDALDTTGEEFHVAVLRMTLEVQSDGRLIPKDPQPELVMVDEFLGERFQSSVKQESDLAPYKPWCDVVVIGDAVAPGRKPMRRFETGIRITRRGEMVLNKPLWVTGPRFWVKRFARGWRLTDPEPIARLPLRYEYAFGGECRVDLTDPAAKRIKKKFCLNELQRAQHPDGAENAPRAHTCCVSNPLGKGYADRWFFDAKKLKHIPAPQIESPLNPVRKFGKAYLPQGLGPLGRAWEPRCLLSGTIDAAFIESGRWLPRDFDFAYWNGAHPDLQILWLKGDETIDLMNIDIPNLNADLIDSQGNRIRRLMLPGKRIVAVARLKEGGLLNRELQIDTLILDAKTRLVSLVYRLKLPQQPRIETLEVMTLSDEEKSILDEHCEAVAQQLSKPREVVYG